MAKLSKKQIKLIDSNINSLLVYQNMITAHVDRPESVSLSVKFSWFNDAAKEINKELGTSISLYKTSTGEVY
jgi:hypothetical protein